MTSTSSLTANDVGAFIRSELREKLTKDFSGRPFRIFRERDLHACSYFHLRRFLRGDSRWVILNEPLLRGLKGRNRGAHPDIALLHDENLVFLIEFKFRRHFSGVQRKDQRVLRKAVRRKKWAKKAYYIQAVMEPSRESRRRLVPYRNKKIIIVMGQDRISEYRTAYRKRRKPIPRNLASK